MDSLPAIAARLNNGPDTIVAREMKSAPLLPLEEYRPLAVEIHINRRAALRADWMVTS